MHIGRELAEYQVVRWGRSGIRDDEAYEGIRVLLEARLANVRIPLQIDVGFGDAIVPAPEELEYPTLLKFPAPKLQAYPKPKESVVAEKFGNSKPSSNWKWQIAA